VYVSSSIQYLGYDDYIFTRVSVISINLRILFKASVLFKANVLF